MISVFWALKPGRIPTITPSSIPGRITHHSNSDRVNRSISSASEICIQAPPARRRNKQLQHPERKPAAEQRMRSRWTTAAVMNATATSIRTLRTPILHMAPTRKRKSPSVVPIQWMVTTNRAVRTMSASRWRLNIVVGDELAETEAAVPGRDLQGQADEMDRAQDDQHDADEYAGRLGLPDQLDRRGEVIAGQPAAEHRNDELRTERTGGGALAFDVRVAHRRLPVDQGIVRWKAIWSIPESGHRFSAECDRYCDLSDSLTESV